jgi:hypothetical protein
MNNEIPDWIVNDIGELGVKINGRCFFMYKGESLEYDDCCHDDDGSPMMYRLIGKREFGETCHPLSWLFSPPAKIEASDSLSQKVTKFFCYPDRYTVDIEFDEHTTEEEKNEFKWKKLEGKTHE